MLDMKELVSPMNAINKEQQQLSPQGACVQEVTPSYLVGMPEP